MKNYCQSKLLCHCIALLGFGGRGSAKQIMGPLGGGVAAKTRESHVCQSVMGEGGTGREEELTVPLVSDYYCMPREL